MDELYNILTSLFGEQRLQKDVLLTPYLESTLFAPLFITVTNKQEIMDTIIAARRANVPFFILDQDNDELQRKKELTGLVIKNNARRFDIIARKGKMQSRRLITDYAHLEAESGTPLNQLVRYTIEEGLGGIEHLLGVGGSVGKVIKEQPGLFHAPQNPIQSVTILTPESDTQEIEVKDLKKDLLVLSVIFKLVGEDTKILWHKARHAAEKRGITEYSTF